MTIFARLLLLLPILLTNCGFGSQLPLDGRTFLSTAVTSNGAAAVLVPGTRIRVAFAEGRVSASAGCNIYGATYQVQDGRLVASGGSMTEMGCDEERMAQDDWLFAFIGARPSITVNGNELVLEASGTVVTLLDREIADPDRPLVGPTWTVTTIFSGDVASSAPDGVVATLIFQADGLVLIETGCNSGGGRYAATAEALRFSEVVTTKRACPGAGSELEAAVLRVLRAETVGYRIDAGSLELRAGDAGLGLSAS